jgi:AbrB family looped-hinge helix DNA binding protein
MDTVTVSSDFQVEIPRAARESLGIQPGQKIQVLLYNNRIEFIPVKPISQMRGFLEGIDTTIDPECSIKPRSKAPSARAPRKT